MQAITPLDFRRARLLVVGDVMLDRYWSGPARRISPEAPVPVVRVAQVEERPGGAANVALNIAAVGAQASLVGAVGPDEAGDRLEERLHRAGVRCRLLRIEGVPTVTKLRVLSQHQQLIRLDFEEPLDGLDTQLLQEGVMDRLGEADLVILSDYAKGTLRLAESLIDGCRAAGKPVLVDPKGSDFSVYRGATLVTPNLSEFEAVVGPCGSEERIEERARKLLGAHGWEAVLVTRGEHGMSLVARGQPALHVAAEAREVYDVTGAGDTVVAILGVAIAAGHELPAAVRLANQAAGIVVGKLGTASVSLAELSGLGQRQASAGGVVSEPELLQAIAAFRAGGERVAMTNGCFDILHAGHVGYLAAARRMAGALIVAVNDDASVRRLKGKDRPINPLAQRMRVLAALSSVDWVVAFTEDTPERLICRVSPEVLVKGGDYRAEEVAGGACVMARGGRVIILPYEEGCSTSGMIAEIRGKED